MTYQVSPNAQDPKPPVDEYNDTQDQDSAVDLLAVWAGLTRRRVFIMSCGGLGLILATILAFALSDKYTSTASFIPPNSTNASSAAAALTSQLSSLGASGLMGGMKTPGDLYAGILKSRSVADVLIDRFHLKDVYHVKSQSDAVKRLAAATKVEVGTKDSIISLSVKDKSPQRARDLANGYLDALRQTNGRLALTEAAQRRQFFDEQLAKEKNNLADAEVALKLSEEHTGLIAPAGQTTLQFETIARLRAQLAARQTELTALKQSATEQNPSVIKLHSVISNLQSQLAQLQQNSDAPGVIPTAKVPAAQLEYVRKTRDVKYHETLFEMIAKQDEIARMDEARDAPQLQILDAASYPENPSFPPRMLLMLGGLILGIAFGASYVIAAIYLQSPRSIFAPARSLPQRRSVSSTTTAQHAQATWRSHGQ